MSFLLAFLLFSCLVFIRFFKKNFINSNANLFSFTFFLGNLNYKNLSDYQNEIETKFDLLQKKILND